MQCHLRDWTAGILPEALDVEMVYDASIESVARYAGEEHPRSERCSYPAEVDMTVLRFKRSSDRIEHQGYALHHLCHSRPRRSKWDPRFSAPQSKFVGSQ